MSDLMGMFHRTPSNPDATGPEYVDEMPDAAASVKRAISVSKAFLLRYRGRPAAAHEPARCGAVH
jgi:hypothetical protein